MINLNHIIMETIYKGDLDRLVKLGQLEVYTQDQVKMFVKENQSEITKSVEGAEELEAEVNDIIKGLAPYKVSSLVKGKLHQEVMFVRKPDSKE